MKNNKTEKQMLATLKMMNAIKNVKWPILKKKKHEEEKTKSFN